MGESFRLLEKTMLIELVYPVSQTHFPLLPNFKKSPRLYWLDIGLVNYASGTQYEVFSSVDIGSAWRGISAEIVVGQELLAYEPSILSKRYFWTRESKNALAEIDFLFSYKGKLIPNEEKTGEKFNSCLLNLYHNGDEGMSWHSDAEKDLKKDWAIGSLSFGAERKFAFKHREIK
jgi:predicted AAA+ superfamily ATPase